MVMGILGKSFEKVSLNVEISLPSSSNTTASRSASIETLILPYCSYAHWVLWVNIAIRSNNDSSEPYANFSADTNKWKRKITINIFKHYIKIVIKFVLLSEYSYIYFRLNIEKKTHVPFFIVILYIYIFMIIFKDILRVFFSIEYTKYYQFS